MGKIGNALAMLRILETGRKYSIKELSEKLEVTPRMVKQYKYELEKAGIYIDTVYGIYGGYIYKRKNNYEVSFSIKDVNVLEKISANLEGKEKTNLARILEKIKTIVIYSEKQTEEDDTEEVKRKYNIISRAIKENEELIIEYKKKERIIIPHNISFYKNYVYVTGYSKYDEDLRTYNLSEINFK